MLDSKFIEGVSRKISALVAETPVSEIEKNVHALMQGIFSKLDMVSREEFDVQAQVLLRTREQLQQLEQRLAELEARSAAKPGQ